ncbi:MAG: FG-GAP-like repeat-containing protein [Chitinophagales bacterium]
MSRFILFLSILMLGSIGAKGQTSFGEEQIISTNADGVRSVYTADLDGDQDVDILSASFGNNKVSWYRNQGNGEFGDEILISTNAKGASSVFAIDLDGDSDIDIISTSFTDGKLSWYKNVGNGNFDEEIIISTKIYNVGPVYAVDSDGDGDADIFSISFTDGKIIWYENDGSGNFSERLINLNGINGASSIYVEDLNGDNNLDFLMVSQADDVVVWYKNDGNGNFDEENIISTNAGMANGVFAKDIDNDGDIDVISASRRDDKIAWYRNAGNGNFSSEILISTNADFANDVYAIDLDNDGDTDIISASVTDNKVAWYENNGSGDFSPEIPISTNAKGAWDVHSADLDGDGDMDILSASVHDDKIAWYENLSGTTKISSFVFQDLNENGIYEDNEKPFINRETLLEPSYDAIFTDQEGYTHYFLQNNEYQLSSPSTALWKLTTPETYNINIPSNSELPTYYFGFKPNRLFPRVEPHLNNSPTRCNREASYWLNYTNTGTIIAKGTITLEIDEKMNFVSAIPEPDVIEDRILTWHFLELHPTHQNKIQLQFQMPSEEFIGEILETQATVQLFNENQELIYSKNTGYNSELLCSYDPNDKLARSNLLGQSEFAYLADTILYTVRFQNTGNDTAFNIRIEDILDKKLDLTTFHPITASHNYRTELNRETGLATFYFDDIMLLDSTTNEEESHGFVMFGIASLEGIGDKTEVDNTASIFFDFNPAIITNTATLTLIEQVETDIEAFHSDYSIRVFPNPFSDYTTIEVSNLPQGNYRLQVMDIIGRKVHELDLKERKVNLEREDLESGLYLVRVLEEGTNRVLGSGKVLIE